MNFIKDCITFFQAGGIFMYPLAACSILLIAAIIYRMFNMREAWTAGNWKNGRSPPVPCWAGWSWKP